MVLGSVVFVSTTSAQNVGFNTASGDWNNAANWTGGTVPGVANGQVYIGRDPADAAAPGSAAVANVTINGAPANNTIGELLIGVGSGFAGSLDGTLNHSTGSLTSNGWTIFGADAVAGQTNTGTYNLSGTADFTSVDQFHLGVGGGPMGGDNIGTFTVADSASLTTNAGFNIGSNDNNTGMVIQTGGTVTANSWISLGNSAGADGLYDISGGQLIHNSDWISVGDNFGGAGNTTGTMIVSGTASIDATVGNGIIVGRNDGAIGALDIIGDSASIVTNNFYVGVNDAGVDTTATGSLSFVAAVAGVTEVDVMGATILGNDTSLAVDLTNYANFGSIGNGTTILNEFVLIDNFTGVSTGIFTGLAEGSAISIGGGKTGILSYVGGADGLDVTVTVFAVPEPGSAIVLTLVAAGFATRRRRK